MKKWVNSIGTLIAINNYKGYSCILCSRLKMNDRRFIMFPTGILDSSGIALLTFYAAVLGVLLLIGIVLRVKIKLFKKIYMPASLIGGIAGLLLSSSVLGILPEEMTSSFAALPGSLIVIVFAPMLLCSDFKNSGGIKGMKDLAVPQLIVGCIGSFMQVGVPCLLTVILLGPVFSVNELFPSIVEVGWAGGHGTAGGMAEVYENLNWTEGTALALTSATTGLLFGIIGGMVMINHGARKGYLSPKTRTKNLSLESQEDMVSSEKQKAAAYETMNSNVADSFAFHFALIAAAIIIGYVIKYLLGFFVEGLPLFPMAMLGGFIVNRILNAMGLLKYVDSHTISRIQGISLDILVVAAVSSIKLSAIVDNIIPIIIVSVAAACSMLFYFYWICPRLFKEDWFEQGILHFGVNTGVTAVGFMLLRTVDPEMKTVAGEAYAIQAPFTSPLLGGGLLTAVLPVMIVNYGNLKIGIACMAIVLLLLLIGKVTGCWHKPQKAVK